MFPCSISSPTQGPESVREYDLKDKELTGPISRVVLLLMSFLESRSSPSRTVSIPSSNRLFLLTRTLPFSKRTRATLISQTQIFTCKQHVRATAAPAIPQRTHSPSLATAKKKTRAQDWNLRPGSKKAGSHKDFCSLITLWSVVRLSFVIFMHFCL